MRLFLVTVGGLVLAFASAVSLACAGSAETGQTDRVGDLIKELGDERFIKREKASKALEEIGEAALPGLRKAAASKNEEIRLRAQRLVANIEKKGGVLFNGKDLTGWQVESGSPEQWKVEDGAIVGRSGDYRTRNYLLSVQDYSDFTLRLEFLLEQNSGGGVVVRGLDGERIVDSSCDHPVLKLTDPAKFHEYCSGTTHFLKDQKQHCRPTEDLKLATGTWHALKITVRGQSCQVTMAGKKVVDLRADPDVRGGMVPGLKRDAGKIGFQAHTGTIRFRNVRLEAVKS
jgi:hypothetical protein